MFKKRYLRIDYLAIFLLLFSLTAVSAQEGHQQKEEVAPAEVVAEPTIIGESKPYTLGKEDILHISVQNQLEFSGFFAIGPDGKIQYSYVGDVQAEGLTKDELKQVLINKLEKFVKLPIVSVAISEYRSKVIYVLGEVVHPGRYPMQGDTITLREAIAMSGLPTREAALRRIYIVKQDTARPTFKKVDLFNVLYKGSNKGNVDLIPGDIVVVPSTIPSEINRALATLLTPFTRARATDLLLQHRWGATESDEF